MTAKGSEPSPGFRAFLVKNWPWVVSLILFFALLPRAVVTEHELQERGKWSEYIVYRLAASRLVAGEPLLEKRGDPETPGFTDYREHLAFDPGEHIRTENPGHPYSYPPTAALLATPLVIINDHDVEATFWHFLTFACLLIGVYGTWLLFKKGTALAGEHPSPLNSRWKWLFPERGMAAFALITFLACAWLVSPVSNQQTDSILFAAMAFGFVALVRKKPILAGVLFGFAGVMKGPLLVTGLWLLCARRWKAAASMTIAGVFLWVLPSLIFPQANGELHIVTWFQDVALPALKPGGATDVGAWSKVNVQNMAIRPTLVRISELADPAGPVVIILKYLGLATVLGIMFLLGRSGWRDVRTTPPELQDDWALRGLAMCSLASLVLSPMTSPSHLCLAFPCLVWLWPRMKEHSGKWPMRIALYLSVVLVFLLHKDLLGRPFVEWYRRWGGPAFLLVALYFLNALMPYRRSERRDAGEAA